MTRSVAGGASASTDLVALPVGTVSALAPPEKSVATVTCADDELAGGGDGKASTPNAAIIQQAASAELTLPSLGRVTVTAKLHEGAVEARLNVSNTSAAEALSPHIPAIMEEVRANNITLRTLDLAGGLARDGFSGDLPRREAPERALRSPVPHLPSRSTAAAAGLEQPRPMGRVRIVL